MMICSGCGSGWTDEELAEAQRLDPRIHACCPERKMRPATYLEARAAHIRAAERTESGRVKRPQGKIIGRLEFFREGVSLLEPFYARNAQGLLVVLAPGELYCAGAMRKPERMTWAIVPETRQMRRQQERREEAQRF